MTFTSSQNQRKLRYFFHGRKRRNEGFKFNASIKFYYMFVIYKKQLCPNFTQPGMKQFWKNWNSCAKCRIQNLGRNSLTSSRYCLLYSKKSKNGYTSHCWGNSAVTNLVDVGMLFINLKQHGLRVSDSVVEG